MINSSDFIEKTEQVRSAIQSMANEMEEQGQKISKSFQQMTDKVSFNTNVIEKVIKSMLGQINEAIKSLRKLDIENQLYLTNLQKQLMQFSEKATGKSLSQKLSISLEIDLRKSFSEDIINQSNELIALQIEIASVCEQMQNAGQQNTEMYTGLQKKSNDLSGAMKNISADDTFKGITAGLEGLSSAFSTASSMLELFSIENETLEKIMQKVQLAISVTNGLQEVNAVLSKESAFQLNVVGQLKMWWRNITLQAAAAQGVETAAASTGTVVNLGLAGSFRAIGLAIKSIPGIGWILAGISALIGLYSLWTSRTKKQDEEQKQLNESVKDFNDSVQQHAAKPVAMIELLSIKFKALGDDINAQKKFIIDNKKAFDELGYSINTVREAQQLLIDNKDKFINAQIAKATALAYEEKMKEKTKKYLDDKAEVDRLRKVVEEENNKTINGIPVKRVGRPRGKEELDLKSDGILLTENEIRLSIMERRMQGDLEDMKALGEQALLESNKAETIMAEIMQGKKKPAPPKEDNKKQIEEAHNKYMRLQEKQTEERVRFAEESAIRIKQAKIDALPDGSDKALKQLELNQAKEKLALKREKEELRQKRIEEQRAIFETGEDYKKAKDSTYEKKEFEIPKEVLTLAENAEFEARNKSLGEKHLNELRAYYASERQAMEEHLKDYGSYEEKRAALVALKETRTKGKSGQERNVIIEEMDKALADLDIKAAESSVAFGQLFSTMKDRSVKDMRAVIETAEEALEFVKGGTWDEDKGKSFGITKESFEALKGSDAEIKKIQENIQNLKKEANSSNTAFDKMGEGFKKLFNADSDPEKLKEALGEIEGAMNEVIKSVQFFSNCLSSLGDAFGSDTLSGIAEGMNVAMDAASSAMSGAQAGAMFGPWGAAAGAAIGLVSSLGSSLAKLHDAKHEKSIQRIQEQIEVLERSYQNLGDSLDKAFSSDAAELIDQQNTLLEQQKVLIGNQIAEEKSKKKTDWGRIKEWEKQIEDIDKVIAKNKEKEIDVFFGEDVKAAIENFAQAYADAWNAGDDRAKSSKELVKNMIKQMIMEAIKAASSQPMEALRKKLAGYFSDDIISDWERQQIEKEAEAITKELDRQFGWADQYMQGEEKESSSQDSTKGGFASMSQETGDELNGRFTALQISNEEIKNSMFFILGNLSALCVNTSNGTLLLTEMRNLAVMSNGHLEDIAKYTKVLLGFGEKLDNIAYNTKSLTVK